MTKKLIVIISLIFSLILISCQNSVNAENKEIAYDSILLKVGNDYYYHFSNIDGQDSIFTLADWYSHKIIIKDTLIGSKEYYLNNYGELYNSQNKILYALENNIDKIQLNYNVNIGDTCYFLSNRVVVKNISNEILFGEKQKVYTVSNSSLSDSILVSGKYCTKFGILNSSITIGNSTSNQNLKALTIEGKLYQ